MDQTIKSTDAINSVGITMLLTGKTTRYTTKSQFRPSLMTLSCLILASCGSGNNSTNLDTVEPVKTVSSSGAVIPGSGVPALGAALSGGQADTLLAANAVSGAQEFAVSGSVETSSQSAEVPSISPFAVPDPEVEEAAQVQVEVAQKPAEVVQIVAESAAPIAEEVAEPSAGSDTTDNNTILAGEQQSGAVSEQLPEGKWVDALESSFYDESRPMAGLFVGTPNGGVYGAANTSNANHHSVRFRAPRTGIVSSVLFQNRLSAVSSVFSRAASQSKYQNCLDYWQSQGVPFVNQETEEQLRKANKCAYHIGNYYSAGNGGSIIFEIRPDIDGFPNMDVAPLGKTNTPFVAIENKPQAFISHPLDIVANVTAGAFYHIVLRNMTPVIGVTSNMSVQAAFAMPDNTGALSLNGLQFSKGVDVPGQQGPYFAGHKTLRSDDQSTEPRNWVEDPDTVGWWGATYSTGELIGFTAAAFDSLSVDSSSGKSGSMYIQGSRYARQVINATHDTTVDGVWVHHGHGAVANGSPMTVNLKQGSNTLATASIPHNAEAKAMVAGAGSELFERTASVWSYQALSEEVDLAEGATYHIEFSAPTGAAFRLFSLANRFGGAYAQIPEYISQNGEAQRSENSGVSWTDFPGAASSYSADRSLQTLLTVKGMPRSLVD